MDPIPRACFCFARVPAVQPGCRDEDGFEVHDEGATEVVDGTADALEQLVLNRWVEGGVVAACEAQLQPLIPLVRPGPREPRLRRGIEIGLHSDRGQLAVQARPGVGSPVGRVTAEDCVHATRQDEDVPTGVEFR
jgi:hypothetical protein